MRNRSLLLPVFCMLALAVIVAPAAAQPIITAGIDVWTTANDGSAYVDFSDNPLPAGFFCGTSQVFAQKIEVKGSPLVTSPAGVLGSTDTVIERASDVDLGSGSGSTAIRVRAISFVNRAPISVAGCSGTFAAKVQLNGLAPAGSMTISGGSGGGTFSASFSVPGRIVFFNSSGQRLGPATETLTMATNGAPWAPSAGSGGISYTNPVSVDTDGDGVADHLTPGTSAGFHPGWWTGCNCPVKVDHTGPHPTWPLPPPPPHPPCATDILSALRTFEAEQASPLPGTDSAQGQGTGEIGDLEEGIEETDESTVTVLSSIKFGSQSLTRIGTTQHTTPCLAVTRAGTHLVAD